MAAPLTGPLRNLLLASQLGLSVHHPLAGWFVLTILYHDARSGSEPITLSYLAIWMRPLMKTRSLTMF